MPVTEDRWHATRRALELAADRFLALATANDPRAMATADWSIADTVAHVGTLASINTHLVRFTDSPVHKEMLTTTVDTVAAFNDATLARCPQSNPESVAATLRADIDDVLRASESADPAAPVVWLGGSRVPLCGLLAHLTNELHIHGYDIARSSRSPWQIPAEHAALFFETFFTEVVRLGAGHLFDGDAPPDDRRISVGFRSRHTTPVSIVLHRGQVSLADWAAPADARVDFDPVVLNLMMFHRISMARAALTGKLRIWGRRPWRLSTFMTSVRAP